GRSADACRASSRYRAAGCRLRSSQSDYHFFDRNYKDALSAGFTELIDPVPKVIFVYDGMQRTPALTTQRHNRRTFHAGDDACNSFNGVIGTVEENVFAVLCFHHRRNAEQQLVKDLAFLRRHVGVGDEYCFRLHDDFHFAEAVAEQGAAAADEVAYGFGQADARGDFHRAADFMNAGLDSAFLEEVGDNVGIRCGYVLSVEPVESVVLLAAGDGQRQPATGKVQAFDDIDVFLFLRHRVFAYDAGVGDAILHVLGNVIVTQEQHFGGKILCGGLELIFPIAK